MTTEKATLTLDQIRTDGGTQPRVAIDNNVVDEYAQLMTDGVNFPPVTVFFDGTDYWLADGFHRYWATRQIEAAAILADIRKGTKRDAVLHSLGANAEHGIRRKKEDKRKAVLTMLSDEKWKHWSNVEIAMQCRVDESTVRYWKASILRDSRSMEPQQSRTFTHPKTGKPTQMRTGNIGRAKKKPTNIGGIAKNAYKPRRLHGEDGPVPMRCIDLPLNNPQQAARSMFSVYEERYLREFNKELSRILETRKGISQ